MSNRWFQPTCKYARIINDDGELLYKTVAYYKLNNGIAITPGFGMKVYAKL